MKQKLHIFMTLLLLVICGGVSFGQTFKKVTSEGDLKAGDVIAIINESAKVALSTDQKTNNRGEQAIELSDDEFPLVSGVQEITLEGESGKWSFKVGAGYLYAASKSANHLKTQSAIDANAQATISFSNGNATIKFIGANTHNTIKYNSTSKVFACYTSGQQTVQIYKKEIQDGKTKTTLSFGADYDGKTITKNVGDYFEALATLTPSVEGATITYESSDETVAEVADGVVEAKKEGTATITAKYAGNDNYKASEVSYTLNVVDGRTATTLTFPTSSYTFGQGDQNGTAVIEDNVAVLSPEGAGKVTYSVSGTDGLASVEEDGSVLVDTKVVGTATVTATFAGNDNYKASETSYTIEVVKKAGQVEDGVFDFTDGTIDYGSGLKPSKATTYIKSSTWKAGNVTITTTSGNGIRWWVANDGNELRVYANTKFAISVPDGYVITNIDLGVYGSMTADCGTLNNSKWTGASQVVTITPSATKNIKNITVKYTKCETLTTAASGFSTYAADYDVDYSAAGLKAYAITLDEAAKTVKYTEATGVVPAGKAVLVKGEANKEYTLAPATEAAGEFTTDLQISDGTVTTEGGLYYAFATVDGKSGFKKLANGMTIPAKKGYLKLSAASAKGFFELDDTTTGIKGISEDIIDEEETPLFNLAGQRVSKSYKGVVVKNGKKFVNK